MSYSGNALVARRPYARATAVELSSTVQPRTSLAVPLLLVGIVLPSGLQLLIAGAKLTPTRIGLIILFLPALSRLMQPNRRLLISDGLAAMLAIGMVVAAGYAAGLQSAFSAAAEALDFVGGYFVARVFVFGPTAIRQFVRLLKVFTAIAICVAVGDVLTGHWIAREAVAAIFPPQEMFLTDDPSSGDGVRAGLRRAISTFDHPILYGVFCSLAAAILLYSPERAAKRLMWAGLCFVGGLLSLSSAAVMGIAIVGSSYVYDQLMWRSSWRWSLLWIGAGAFVVAVTLAANNPLSWILSHVTFDPQTGFYRLMIWDAVSAQVWQAPLTGAGFVTFGYYLLDRTVDSVWLVTSLHYGVPVTILLIGLNLSALLPVPGQRPSEIQRGFTIVCLVFLLTGLTVHFWNYMWTFWGVCIGVRASLREWQMLGAQDEQL
ncbi:hypothetical protein UB31_26685 [Bradyrhizobium sp. LTSP849]|jgi:hypothetical protein|uniref:O-antigen ligase family protein n=1 Tax=unclassified Bradyrhizobium TaxID=2631580 RepID=UPI0005D16C8E|nr:MULTISPECIES: hypothetical protein [unclassified Bradyrhizobium]KJC40972.1 hypothetical protein UB31_26685 [Bradyrhizobium sp. LTSP849]KJC50116.1 hypothetical protein UP06_07000 [Bradyrhizobium sp. LTSP857]